jgi:hypothetical protein
LGRIEPGGQLHLRHCPFAASRRFGSREAFGCRPRTEFELVAGATGPVGQDARRNVLGYANALGEATNAPAVSVSTKPAYRKDRHFPAELAVDTAAGGVWLGLTNDACTPVG